MALVIGVTGAIAAGKRSLCAYLVERHGAVHADADRVVHRTREMPELNVVAKASFGFGDVNGCLIFRRFTE